MNSAFDKLPEEKKNNILNICIQEFAEKGYENATTDTITSRAGISKGILFHYFGSKKKLYLYLIEYILDLLAVKTREDIEKISSNDFFERVKEVSLIKQRIMIQYPNESKLLINCYISPPLAVKKELEELMKKAMAESQPLSVKYLFRYMSKESLKDNVSVEKAIEVAMYLFDKLSEKYLQLYKGRETELIDNPEPILKELDEFVDIIKYGIYKQ